MPLRVGGEWLLGNGDGARQHHHLSGAGDYRSLSDRRPRTERPDHRALVRRGMSCDVDVSDPVRAHLNTGVLRTSHSIWLNITGSMYK